MAEETTNSHEYDYGILPSMEPHHKKAYEAFCNKYGNLPHIIKPLVGANHLQIVNHPNGSMLVFHYTMEASPFKRDDGVSFPPRLLARIIYMRFIQDCDQEKTLDALLDELEHITQTIFQSHKKAKTIQISINEEKQEGWYKFFLNKKYVNDERDVPGSYTSVMF